MNRGRAPVLSSGLVSGTADQDAFILTVNFAQPLKFFKFLIFGPENILGENKDKSTPLGEFEKKQNNEFRL